jgi:acetyl-CoA C-acetyltransferase
MKPGTKVVIAGAARTPIGRFKGAFSEVPAPRLGAIAVREAIRRARIEPKDVSELFFGSVIQAGLYQNCARQVVIFSGIPESVSGTALNMVCGSGMKAIAEGVRAIEDDPDAIIVAGGTENMTRAPYLLPRGRQGFNLGHAEVLDSMITDGLWDIYNDFHMAIGGELIAEKLGLTREMCDEYALRSQTFANKATESGRFAKEIVPVEAEVKGKDVTVARDEGIRPDTSLAALARLPPAFKDGGVLTAGNSSQISDGASATVLMSEHRAREIGVEPLGTIVDFCSQAVRPADVMFAPIPCVQKLMKRTGLTIDDFDLVEHNEAFSSASVGVRRELGIPWDVFNIHGGAVALGHPIGCSGNRIVVTLLHSMRERDVRRGLATLCIGGGDAMAMVLER